MSKIKWSNLAAARPLCRHMIEAELRDAEGRLGGAEFAAMIRKAYSVLYGPNAAICECEPRSDA